jgi:uncharacterized protein
MTQEKDKKTAWRTAVRRAMHDAAHAQNGEAPFNYRWEHVQAVVTVARRLAEHTGADADVVEAAAWLHDVRKETGEIHAAVGATFARGFLPQTDFPPEKIDQVAQAIANHKGLWREEPLAVLEDQVLWDADKLTKLGLTAALHWTALRLIENEAVTARDLIAVRDEAQWSEQTVVSMHTEPARRAAARRLEAFRSFWNRLEAELGGEDV